MYTVEGDVRDDGAKYSYELSMSGMNGVKCPHGGAVCQYEEKFNRVVGASDHARFYIDCLFLLINNKALNNKKLQIHNICTIIKSHFVFNWLKNFFEPLIDFMFNKKPLFH